MITALIVLAIVGFGLWLLTTMVPMEPRIKTAIIGIALFLCFLYIIGLITGKQILPL
jgi:hypothetical protein